ncbi:membrane protein [Acrocarpospora pleiomorpha]|uniref:Membrane protein n=1 Tax=Acrocarpospora pleiomorpha TaxID=90975 RepID=A0A5M3XMA4_9ACTN|nr:SPFH domain-containing protein [Acrocarpospora pleiomorpha]GES22507.1 membrane protein [Acrocarpospora pleiomorpha]
MERQAFRVNGFWVLLAMVVVAAILVAVVLPREDVTAIIIGVVGLVLIVLLATGFTVINPNEAKVVQFFGRYVGSVKDPGFQFVIPLTDKRRVTLRVRNFETAKLKVNDADGSPVEIAAVVVFRVVETAKASFSVDNYEEYVAIQSEAAVRHLATTHPYDSHIEERTSLRDGATIAEELTTELRDRTELAGIEIMEARITHLAYAPEIAQAMLVRQQASQVVAARRQIVEGAVGMVQLALDRLSAEHVVELDEERRATMVSNLLVVLCGDRAVQPVVNTGSLYA